MVCEGCYCCGQVPLKGATVCTRNSRRRAALSPPVLAPGVVGATVPVICTRRPTHELMSLPVRRYPLGPVLDALTVRVPPAGIPAATEGDELALPDCTDAGTRAGLIIVNGAEPPPLTQPASVMAPVEAALPPDICGVVVPAVPCAKTLAAIVVKTNASSNGFIGPLLRNPEMCQHKWEQFDRFRLSSSTHSLCSNFQTLSRQLGFGP